MLTYASSVDPLQYDILMDSQLKSKCSAQFCLKMTRKFSFLHNMSVT